MLGRVSRIAIRLSSTESCLKTLESCAQVAHAGTRAQVHRQLRDVAAVEDDRAAVGVDQADRHPEAGRLAGPVGPEQADDLAPVDVEVDAVDDLAAAVPLLQPADFAAGASLDPP